jgi:hypothetical protein
MCIVDNVCEICHVWLYYGIMGNGFSFWSFVLFNPFYRSEFICYIVSITKHILFGGGVCCHHHSRVYMFGVLAVCGLLFIIDFLQKSFLSLQLRTVFITCAMRHSDKRSGELICMPVPCSSSPLVVGWIFIYYLEVIFFMGIYNKLLYVATAAQSK